MKRAIRWSNGLPLVALALFTCAAMARPLLVPPQRLAVPPAGNPPYQGYIEPMYSSVAIDGGTLLATAHRPLNDQNERVDGVYIFERNAEGRWAYSGVLTEEWPGIVMLNGNLATTSNYPAGIKIFERGANGWAVTGTLPFELGQVFRIEDGSIYVQQRVLSVPDCSPPYQQFRKVNGTWTQVATLGGERCDRTEADVNDGRAIIVRWPYEGGAQPPGEIFAPSGGSAWTSIASIPPPPQTGGSRNLLGPWGTIRGDTAYIDPGYLYRRSGGNSTGSWVRTASLVEPETEVSPSSYEGKLRGNFLFLRGEEQDYELNSLDWEVSLEWRVLRVYRQTPSGFVYHARLNADFDVWGWSVSEDGRHVAAYGANHNNSTYNESLRLYVFEVPETTSFPGTQQDTFSAGNFSRWTPTAGQFAVVPSGATRVLRQSSLAGDAGAHLTAVDWTDQAIEADMRPLEFAGADRWFGLVTRRTDARNYYYVTFRAPGRISIRRMLDGDYTELGYAIAPGGFQPGRNYRVRFESVGDQHVVFLDGFPMLHVKDDTLARGHPGIAGYRARFDIDNVIVSGGTRILLRFDSYRRAWSEGFRSTAGTWEFASDAEDLPYYLRQSDPQADVRWISKIVGGYQVVSTRIRPRSQGTADDPWVGLAVHVVDDSNYYYMTLQRSQQLSLRRLVNGQIQVLATVPQALTLGAWHDLRLEIIGTRICAFVNGDLKIEVVDDTLRGRSGRNALLMYKTAADVESYVAYQP